MRITWHGGKPTKPTRSDLTVYVGKRLYYLRQSWRVTQREVSDATGLAISFVCDLENGKRSPSFETIWKLAKYFGVGVDWFVEGYVEKRKRGGK